MDASTIRAATSLATVLFLGVPRPAAAHLGIDEQIVEVSARIAAAPGDAALHLRRGDLHRLHGDVPAALGDYLEARRLAPELPAADICLGKALLDAGWPAQALIPLDRFLLRRPDHAEGLALRGRARLALGQGLAAAADFTRAIQASAGGRRPRPEHYLDRARALVSEGPRFVDEALRGLEEGLEALARPITLELLALEIEVEARRHPAALARLDRLAERSPRKEGWLVRRGEVLEGAGRTPEALLAYRQALSSIDSLARSRPRTRSLEGLEARARAAVERLDRPQVEVDGQERKEARSHDEQPVARAGAKD